MLTGVNLPDAIVPEILARLPAKTLGRFKLVSKPFRTLISDPKFIKTHLSCYNSGRRSKLLLLLSKQRSLAVVDFNGEPPISSNHSFQQIYKVYGSCDGLVLALNTSLELILLNPTTNEFRKLPKPSRVDLESDVFTCGIGYDLSSDDYKVVVISHSKMVNVYRLKCNSWYIVQDSPFDCSSTFEFGFPGVFLNGCLNWFGTISELSPITAFDLADDKFRKVPLPLPPPYVIVIGTESNPVNLNVNDIGMWIVKEFGVYEYRKEFVSEFSIGCYTLELSPLIVLGNDEFAFAIFGKIVALNGKERTARYIVVPGLSGEEDHKCTFVESLVSLDQLG